MQKFLRWGGFIGSLSTGVSVILNGDPTTGTGIILAGFSSASVIPTPK